MIETSAKIAETSKTSEVDGINKSMDKTSFDPDKRAEYTEEKSDIVGNRDEYDPDKRAEYNEDDKDTLENKDDYDPDKRAECNDNNLEKNVMLDKEKIKEEQGWSDNIINHIDSMEQYEIYKNADLCEAVIDGRTCLIKSSINMDYVDPKTGFTNKELMKKGRAPIDFKTGEKIELHHMQQDFTGPFAELCGNSEHGDGNDTILHDKNKESWRHDDEKKYQYDRIDRPNHWKARVEE